MTRNSMNAGNGFVKSLVVVIAAGSLSLVGCGSDLSTAPMITGAATQDEPGEVIRPTKDARLEAPRNFQAEALGGNPVRLTWDSPVESGLTAILQVNGQTLIEMSADTGIYVDNLGKPAGTHTYDICFVKGNQSSRHAQAAVVINAQGGNAGGRTDDRPELDD